MKYASSGRATSERAFEQTSSSIYTDQESYKRSQDYIYASGKKTFTRGDHDKILKAARERDLETIKTYEGLDFKKVRDKEGFGLLHVVVKNSTGKAASCGAVVEYLTQQGMKVDDLSSDGENKTPLHIAAEIPNSPQDFNQFHQTWSGKSVIDMLIEEFHADIFAKDRDGNTALDIAAKSNYAAQNVKNLLKFLKNDCNSSEDFERNTEMFNSALKAAVAHSKNNVSAEVVEMLLRHGADQTVKTASRSFVGKKAKSGTFETRNLSLLDYAKHRLEDEQRAGAFESTIAKLGQVIKLLEHDQNFKKPTTKVEEEKENDERAAEEQSTKIVQAARECDLETIKTYEALDFQKVRDEKGFGLLHMVVENSTGKAASCGAVVEYLTHQGMKVDDLSSDGENKTPLHIAAEIPNSPQDFNQFHQTWSGKSVIDMLIEEFHADIFAKDRHGNTALDIAAKSKFAAENVKNLLKFVLFSFHSLNYLKDSERNIEMLSSALKAAVADSKNNVSAEVVKMLLQRGADQTAAHSFVGKKSLLKIAKGLKDGASESTVAQLEQVVKLLEDDLNFKLKKLYLQQKVDRSKSSNPRARRTTG